MEKGEQHKYNFEQSGETLGDRFRVKFMQDIKKYLDYEESLYQIQINRYKDSIQRCELTMELIGKAIESGDIEEIKKVYNEIWGNNS